MGPAVTWSPICWYLSWLVFSINTIHLVFEIVVFEYGQEISAALWNCSSWVFTFYCWCTLWSFSNTMMWLFSAIHKNCLSVYHIGCLAFFPRKPVSRRLIWLPFWVSRKTWWYFSCRRSEGINVNFLLMLTLFVLDHEEYLCWYILTCNFLLKD